TNANLIPVLSFAQAILGWEWKYGSSDFQQRFTPEYVRAVNIGRQTGTIPLVLDGITGVKQDSDEFVRLTRTALALALPHEIYFYGGTRIHAPTVIKAMQIISNFRSKSGTEVYPYWDSHRHLTIKGDLLVTAYRYHNNVLLVIGNMGEDGKYTIQIHPAQLGVGGLIGAENSETGQKIPVNDNVLELKMLKHDFSLVEVALKPAS